ncbi:MAG: TetR/AcrR family transcriptional regulator [Myxococcota bacterium]
MTSMLTKVAKLEKQAEERDERRQARRDELARSAIATLSVLGYSQTSLRDIAEHSGKSVGLIHYYFADKDELIVHCIALYKQGLIDTVDDLMASVRSPQEARNVFVEAMVSTVEEQAKHHRLWYDINAQAMFNPRIQPELWAIEKRLVAMIGRMFEKAGIDPSLQVEGFTSIEGAFHHYLFQYLFDEPNSLERFREHLHVVLNRF